MKKWIILLTMPIWVPLTAFGWVMGVIAYFVGGGFLIALQYNYSIKEWEKINRSKDAKP